MNTVTDSLLAPVSFGLNIRKPEQLETCTTGRVLVGLGNGEWKKRVEHVRSLDFDSDAQKHAKQALPYVIWAGKFNGHSSVGLVQHSGQIAIDLDGLRPRQVKATFHRAIDD